MNFSKKTLIYGLSFGLLSVLIGLLIRSGVTISAQHEQLQYQQQLTQLRTQLEVLSGQESKLILELSGVQNQLLNKKQQVEKVKLQLKNELNLY